MSDKCFIPGGHGHADGQDLAYPLQTSATEGNPTNTRAANSDELLPLCVSNNPQIFIACPQHVTTTLNLSPGKNRTDTDIPDICFRGTVPLGGSLCPGAHTLAGPPGFPEAGQEDQELHFLPRPVVHNKLHWTVMGRKEPQLERPSYLHYEALQVSGG